LGFLVNYPINQIDDIFRSRLDEMLDLRRPLAVIVSRMPWQQIAATLAHQFARQDKAGKQVEDIGLFGPEVKVVGVASPMLVVHACWFG
jgi:transposase, IS5 family